MIAFVLVIFGIAVWAAARTAAQVKDERGRLRAGALSSQLKLHEMQVKGLSDPSAIMKARIAFAERLQLGPRLLKFYHDVRPIPLWYASGLTSGDSAPWTSTVIPKDAVHRGRVKDLRPLGVDLPDYLDASDTTFFRFSAAGSEFVYCAHSSDVPDEVAMVGDQFLAAMKAYVVELPSRLVLEGKMFFTSETYTYQFDSFEAFRPGEWLGALLKIADDLRAERDASYKASVTRIEEERAKKFL